MENTGTKHFADLNGKYLGGFGHGAKPDLPASGYVEASEPPKHTSAKLVDGIWVEPDLTQERRESASLSRQSFCLDLLDREILTPADATMAAEGRWPNALLPMFEEMTEAEKAKTCIIWASSTSIHRMHPLLLKVAALENLNIPDSTLDDIFGCNLPLTQS